MPSMKIEGAPGGRESKQHCFGSTDDGDEAAEAIAAFGPDRTLTAQADFVLKFGERSSRKSHHALQHDGGVKRRPNVS